MKGYEIKSAWAFKKGASAQGHDEIRKQVSIPQNNPEMWAAFWFEAQSGGLTKSLTDSIELTDIQVKAHTRALAEFITTSDQNAGLFSRNLSDFIALGEASGGKSFSKTITDLLTSVDQATKNATAVKTDSVTPTDSSSKVSGINKSDSFIASDSLTKIQEKPLSDQLTASDALAKFQNKEIVDQLTAIDDLIKGIHKSQSDDVSLSDSIVYDLIKLLYLSDSVALTEESGKGLLIHVSDDIITVDNYILDYLNRAVRLIATMDKPFDLQVIENELLTLKSIISSHPTVKCKTISCIKKYFKLNGDITIL